KSANRLLVAVCKISAETDRASRDRRAVQIRLAKGCRPQRPDRSDRSRRALPELRSRREAGTPHLQGSVEEYGDRYPAPVPVPTLAPTSARSSGWSCCECSSPPTMVGRHRTSPGRVPLGSKSEHPGCLVVACAATEPPAGPTEGQGCRENTLNQSEDTGNQIDCLPNQVEIGPWTCLPAA